MLKLLAFLWTGCWHKWGTIEVGNVIDRPNGQIVGRFFHERCERCGVNRYRQQW